ncbi:radical SAM protein [Flavobacterium sp. F372]|uniref:Radical SAM protein n=1 Tax=Flavobacterium bernardetii TaxID=2813823 RepID=A0ABR7J1U8_9FLAO|nr:radical SAM protein [Flavobacterium bernardetii]MBC5836006.1 radical SAM protein [Flavobacterium bernardetii]NHF71254.1 radical SAM protein [Flavobacterium bernardetii]
MEQLNLFGDEEKKKSIGTTSVGYTSASSILTKASGFMEDYDFTLNPYSGCSFGCTYCYAAFFSRDKDKMDNWGKWISVKENALSLLMKQRKKPLQDKTIYLSSVTDPYQPIEKELELTRNILKELIDYHNVRLVVQTRSPLVTRDIDLFKKFKVIQVNMTITTDSEKVRKVFEPYCTGNKQRLNAIKEVSIAGVQSCITMTPLLPVDDAYSFAETLLETGIKKFIIQPFHKDKGKFVAGTRAEAMKILSEYNWDDNEYQRVLKVMQQLIPNLGIGKTGFAPI